VLLARDDVGGALEDLAEVLDDVRRMKDSQFVVPALAMATHVHVELGHEDEARALAAEFLRHADRTGEWRMVDFAFVAEELGHADDLRQLLERLPETRLSAANLALVSGERERAAELFQEAGMRFAAADAHRFAARRLAQEGRPADAAEQLARALAFYRPVGATRYLRECEELLGDLGLEVPA
jgi:hypothetical protein